VAAGTRSISFKIFRRETLIICPQQMMKRVPHLYFTIIPTLDRSPVPTILRQEAFEQGLLL